MATQRKSRQRGISFIGLIFTGTVLALGGVVAAQVFPTYLEFQAITKAVNKAALSDGGKVAEIRLAFEKAAAVDDIKSITSKDLVVSKESNKVVVSFEYQREIHLAGPAYLTMKYAGRSE